MNIVVDVGNTRVKCAFFESLLPSFDGCDMVLLYEKIAQLKKEGAKLNILLAGSGEVDDSLRQTLKEKSDFWMEAHSGMPLPIEICYDTPETLGIDRIAACVGAKSLFPGRPLLVIDAGTAITFDYVSCEGVFLGGNISPGVEIRFRALNQFTARLPHVSPEMSYDFVGKTTGKAILSGVMSGICFEINGYIRQFTEQEPGGVVVFTGGDSRLFVGKLLKNIEMCSELGLVGLNEILRYNLKMR